MPDRSHVRFLLTAAGCLFLAGCVTKSVGNAGTSVHYARWLPIAIFLVGLVAVPVGLVLRKHTGRLGWGLIIIGPLAALMFAPSLFLERVVVSDDGFESHSGIWGMTAGANVDFDSVTSIRIAEEKTGGRRSRWIEVLYFEMKAGEDVRLPLNNDVKIEAAMEIIERAAQRGIPVVE